MKVGDVVGNRFEIQRRAGVGGMGVVYQAIDQATHSPVALKMLHHSPEDEAKSRFLREARLVFELRHPAMVSYVAHGATPAGDLFLAMEWLDGEDLLARIHRKGLDVGETVVLAKRITEALAYAHARGIIHRDIKPKNLYLLGGEVARVKVLDFGIAHMAVGTQIAAETGVLGTPGYMAPEQARGDTAIDGRADLFSLGCVMFHCLAGKAPFGGGDMLAIAAKLLLEDSPRVDDVRADLPLELSDLVNRMLAKDPAGRPRSADAVLAALDALPELGGVESKREARVADASTIGEEEQRSVCVVVAAPEEAPSGAGDHSIGLVADIADRFGARVERLRSGGFVAVMSASGSATDQALTAVRCARTLREREPNLRCAVAIGRGIVTGGLPVGEVIDRAVGILRANPTASIAIDDSTAGLVEEHFDLDTSSSPKTGKIAVVRGERSGGGASRTLLGRKMPCFGRERELATLEAAFRSCAVDSTSHAVLVTGAPGVGKTRLLTEFVTAATARQPDVEVWTARADAMSAGSPFRLLGQAVASGLGLRESDPPEQRHRELASRISHLVGEADAARITAFIAELVGLPMQGASGELDAALRAARQNPVLMGDQMLRAFEDLLAAVTTRSPLVLVLEDLHWGDLPSVRFVDAALRSLKERPFLALGVARPEVSTLFPSLWAEQDMTELRLKGLGKKASERFVLEALGEGASLERVSRIVDRAEGNAFFLEELVRAVAEGREGDALPETVLATVEARLAELPGEARRVLRAASIFGQSFWRGGVLALLGETSASNRLPEWLKMLEERELVARRPTSRFADEVEFAFRHALGREAAYHALTEKDRAIGHRLAAEWLERAGERDAVLLAEHLERGGEPGRAIAFYEIAAQQALEGNDFDKVIARAARGVEAGAEGAERAKLLLLSAEARSWRGENAKAMADVRGAIDDARRIGGELHHRAIYGLATFAGRMGQHDQVIELAREMKDLEPDRTFPERYVEALAVISNSLFNAGYTDLGDATLARIEAVAMRLPNSTEISAHLHRARSFAHALRSNFEGTLRELIAAADAYEELGDYRVECAQRVNVGNWQTELGALEAAEASLRSALETADRLGLKTPGANARSNLGRALYRAGRLAEAATVETVACEMFLAQGNPRLECASRAYLSQIRLAEGDLDAAQREADRALEIAPSQPDRAYAHALLANVALARHEPEEALGHAVVAITSLDELGGIDEGEIMIRLAFVESLYAARRYEEAKAALRFAHDRLSHQISLVENPDLKRSSLERVPENARTAMLAKQWLGLESPLRS